MNSTDSMRINYLNGKNTVFFKSGDFIGAETNYVDHPIPRVHLHRMFPFSEPFTNISVQDDEGEEIGLIASIADFSPETAKMLRDELEKSYFVPKITEIFSVKEKFGFSAWKVSTDVGDLDFTLRDTYRSMIFAGGGRIFLVDSDGNRYEIPDVAKLDAKSYKLIELYI